MALGSNIESRRNRLTTGRTAMLVVAVTVGGAVALAALVSASSPTNARAATVGARTTGGVLRFARALDASVGLNPINAPDNGSIFTIKQIFEPLVDMAAGKEPVPGLARSWKTSAGGKVWTFKLRNARFSNGAKVTADDAVFSLRRFADPKVNVAYTTLGASIKSVKALDPATVQVTLKRVDGAFLDNLAMFAASVVPRRVVERIGDKRFADHPIGSGPFMVTKFTKGRTIELARNPYYWRKGYPLLDGVVFEFTPNANTRVLKLRSGEVDVADSIPVNQVDSLDRADGVDVLEFPSLKWDAIWLSTKEKPLTDVLVRRALNYATPKEQILKAILFGHGEVANSLIAKVKYWDKRVAPYPYDLDKAKMLLSKSSAPNGFKLNLIIVAGDPVEKQTAEVVKSEWGKIGVDVTIVEKEFGAAFSSWLGGKSGGAASFPGDALSSDTLSDDELSELVFDPAAGLNSLGTKYANPRVIRLIKEANATLNEQTRAQKFAQVQRITMQDAPAVPLYFTTSLVGERDNVKGLVAYPGGWWNLWEVSLDK